MNILTIKSNDQEYMDNFTDQLLFLNQIIGKEDTTAQLEMVQHWLTPEGKTEMEDMIEASILGDTIKVEDEKDFKIMMNLLLLDIQEPLGAVMHSPRGAGSSNKL